MRSENRNRILLIVPHGNIPDYWFPLGVGYLKSNMPDRYQVKILDCTFNNIKANSPEFQEELKKFAPDFIGVSTASLTYAEGLEVLRVAKSLVQDIVTVMGGPHPTIYTEGVMQNEFVDFLIQGEGELSFPAFLDQFNNERDFSSVSGLVFRKDGAVVRNEVVIEKHIDKIRIPDYQALSLNGYIKRGYNYGGFYGKTAPIWVTRGCPYRCKFCSAPLINGNKIRTHSISYMVKWIDHLYNEFDIRQFSIVDDNFTFNIDYAKQFCREIIRLNETKHYKEKIYFTTPNGIRMQRVDDELLLLMKRAGWEGVTIAPESGSKKTLERMRKNLDPDIVGHIW